MENYKRQLANPLWQKKRLEIMQRDSFTCQLCFANDQELHVHHKYYLPNTQAWEYSDSCYITLCHECHEFETNNFKKVAEELIQNMKVSCFDSQDANFLSETFKLLSDDDLGRSSRFHLLSIFNKLVRLSHHDGEFHYELENKLTTELDKYGALKIYEKPIAERNVETV